MSRFFFVVFQVFFLSSFSYAEITIGRPIKFREAFKSIGKMLQSPPSFSSLGQSLFSFPFLSKITSVIQGGVVKTEEINDEAKRRDDEFKTLLKREKTFEESVTERQERIKELQQKIEEARYSLKKPADGDSVEEMQVELNDLLANSFGFKIEDPEKEVTVEIWTRPEKYPLKLTGSIPVVTLMPANGKPEREPEKSSSSTSSGNDEIINEEEAHRVRPNYVSSAWNSLNAVYNLVYESFKPIAVGDTGFERIISEDLVTEAGGKPIVLVNGLKRGSLVQFKDWSGIGAISLAYYLAVLSWHRHVLVLPAANLTEASVLASTNKIVKAYLGLEKDLFLSDDEAFKGSLIIVSGYGKLEGLALDSINELQQKMGCSIVVISDWTIEDPTCLASADCHSFFIGLKASDDTVEFADGTTKKISTNSLFHCEKQARNLMFMQNSQYPGSIGVLSMGMVELKQNRQAIIRPQEHRVSHRPEFVRNSDHLVDQLLKCYKEAGTFASDRSGYFRIQFFGLTADWFAGAVTAEASRDPALLWIYNIAGRLFVRAQKDNYLKYMGVTKDVSSRILEHFLSESKRIEQEMQPVQPDRKSIVLRDLISKALRKLLDCTIKNTAGQKKDAGGVLKADGLAKYRDLDSERMDEISYFALQQRLSKAQTSVNNTLACIRKILKNEIKDGNEASIDLCTVVACIFISEAGRNPATFLPSLMLLDLMEKGVECGINGWEWKSFVSHGSLENDIQIPRPFRIALQNCYADFGGQHPMAHRGSYFQSEYVCKIPSAKRGNLLSWVEYKSYKVMNDWLKLSCKIKKMEADGLPDQNPEIVQRFMGRLAKSSVIDSDIDDVFVKTVESE